MKNIKQALMMRVMFCFLCMFYGPLFLLGYAIIAVKRYLWSLKVWSGIGFVKVPRLGKLCRKTPISEITRVSTEEEIKFMKYRSPLYLYRTTIWTAKELSRLFAGDQTVILASEQDIMYAAVNSVFAHSVRWDEDEQMYTMSMPGFDKYILYKSFHWELRAIKFNEDCTTLKIVLTHNREYTWPCNDDQLDDWNLAKLHAQVCLTYFAPGLSHNYVHFVFPSSVAVLTKTLLARTSFLFKLLEPHTSFTERINYQALNLNKSTSNKRSFKDKYFCFWKAIPISMEQFVEGVAGECHKYYYENTCRNYKGKECTNFPPSYVRDEKLQRIPYLKFLSAYYDTIHKFVADVAHLIDRDEWEMFSSALASHVPGVDKVDMIDVISTFIHQVGVVHVCDHLSYLRYFAYSFGCMAIRSGFESWKDASHWDEVMESMTGLRNVAELRKDPLKLLRSSDIMKTRCFLNIFVDFIPDWVLDLKLVNTSYDFDHCSEQKACEAVNNFRRSLIATDEALAETVPTIQPHKKGYVAEHPDAPVIARNLQLVPVDSMIRSVCF